MSQKTETDLRELKDLITGLKEEVRLGFAEVKGKLDVVDSRLTLVEASITKLDGRLWGFIGLALTVTLGSLLTVFIRFMFANTPNL
jgi:hypothetical protein